MREGNGLPDPGETLRISGPQDPEIFTPAAIDFLARLCGSFAPRIESALLARAERRARWAEGESLSFRKDTASIRNAEWTVAPIPADLTRRVVEITGPPDRKMIVNALNSGADVFMADFEDATAPTWDNLVSGQRHLQGAVRRSLAFDDPTTGKAYRLNDRLATLVVRPRGLHLPEAHVTLNGKPVPGALFDFGLYFFHNAAELVRRGSGPYFYLPKLECSEEAALWNDVFVEAQALLGLPRGTIRATVLLETLPAAFEMDEILYALREHSSGLNCGRWDYIFSMIKARRTDPLALLPDRAEVTMEQPSMRAYSQLVIRTCHRRGIHAMGGMAAQIPIKGDPEANERALARVRRDKEREAADGHDGTWVAHPGLVAVARELLEAGMQGPHQIARRRDDVRVTAEDLLQVPLGRRTEAGLRLNIRVGVQYLEAWLGGLGCVPLYHLMEDAATAEISRTQVWQWLRHRATLDDGRAVTPALFRSLLDDEMNVIEREVGPARVAAGRFAEAKGLFQQLALAPALDEFLTIVAYPQLNRLHDAEPRTQEPRASGGPHHGSAPAYER